MINAQKTYNTKAEKAKEQKKEFEQQQDELKETDGSQGQKYVKDVLDSRMEQEKIENTNAANQVDMSKSPVSYKEKLCSYGNKRIPDLDLPEGWKAVFTYTSNGQVVNIKGRSFKANDGLLLVLSAPNGKHFIKGLALTYIVDIDLKNVRSMLVQAENTSDAERKLLYDTEPIKEEDTNEPYTKTESGIYLPK